MAASKKSPLSVFVKEMTRKFVNITNEPRVKDMIRFGSSVFSESEPFMKSPSKWNAARAVVGTLKAYIEDVEIWPDTFFESGSSPWERLYDYRVAMLTYECLVHVKNVPDIIKTADSTSLIYVHEFETFKIGYVFNTKTHTTGSEVFYLGDKQAAHDAMSMFIWDKVNSTTALLRLGGHAGQERHISIDEDTSSYPLSSQRATDYARYLQRCVDASVNRSIMFYGPPGTGKSTMARAIVDILGFRSLRIRVEDIQHVENSTIQDIFQALKPDVVIFDDFDRADRQTKLLEMLEELQRSVKVVIATVNDRSNLDEALLRPGRFDEMVMVDKMEEPVIRHLLGEACADLYDTVAEWPIAYINEIVKRRRFLSREDAKSSIEELIVRVSKLSRDIETGNGRRKDDAEASFVKKVAKLISKEKPESKDDDDDESDEDEEDDLVVELEKFRPKPVRR